VHCIVGDWPRTFPPQVWNNFAPTHRWVLIGRLMLEHTMTVPPGRRHGQVEVPDLELTPVGLHSANGTLVDIVGASSITLPVLPYHAGTN